VAYEEKSIWLSINIQTKLKNIFKRVLKHPFLYADILFFDPKCSVVNHHAVCNDFSHSVTEILETEENDGRTGILACH